jgi:hypothetical protein
MGLIADILLIAGALGAAVYCLVLARKLSRLTGLESGMGGAIAVLSGQVDDMTRVLAGAQAAAQTSSERLGQLTARAEETARRLELLLASMHDLDSRDNASPDPGRANGRSCPAHGAPEDTEAEARFLTRRARLESSVQ